MLLSEYLARHRIRQSHFAKSVGVTPSHIIGLINGSTQPSIDLAQRIHEETGGEVPPESFFRTRQANGESDDAHRGEPLSSEEIP